jgi:hypothetical protein
MNPGQDIIILVSKDSRIPITRPKALSTNDSTSGLVNELLTRVPAYLEASNIYDYFGESNRSITHMSLHHPDALYVLLIASEFKQRILTSN